MGTFLTIMFCLFVVVVFIALIVVFCVAVSAFGEKFYEYIQDASEEYFDRKRERDIKIRTTRAWHSNKICLKVNFFGFEKECNNVAEMVSWLKEQGVE